MPDPGSLQSSSPRPSSSSGGRQIPPPNYLSARSADVILSEVRPTRIKSEALRSVNVLLDELLWLILGCACSFATDRLRTGLLKVLPTSLGKDALLEAEVELRAYIERNPLAAPLSIDESALHKFPLEPAFDLLRVKCEAYSSLGDQAENPETETALQMQLVQIAGDAAPKVSDVAPAALYLTAILEHICEHVLSNVGRVVARDSSRTTAHAHDLYVALCEDETIYSLFKTMKVQAQIEQQSKMPRPRRSKSFSRNDLGTEAPQPLPSSDAPAVPKPRPSLDSAISNGSNPNIASRTSMDKGRSKGLFKNSSSRNLTSESGNSNTGEGATRHRRSNSLLGDKKHSMAIPDDSFKETYVDTIPADDDASMQEFDDLMRSGTTMKVSLTPDRLKTFEVFAKEKNQRANRPGHLPPSPSGRDSSTPPSSFPNGAAHLAHKANPSKARNQVESIAETPEDPVRPRAASITSPAAPKEDNPPFTSRSRSFTDTRGPPARAENSSSPSFNKPLDIPTSNRTMPVAVVDPTTAIPKRTRRAPPRNRESLDLDDIMDGSDDDEVPVARKVMLTPKSAQTTTTGTRDLMDFLSEGPPEAPVATPLSTGPSVTESQRSKQGRFRNIVSRLTGSSSSEKLSPRPGDDSIDTFHRSQTLGANGATVSSRSQPAPLHIKRSTPNVAAAGRSMGPSLPSPLSSNSHENTIPQAGLRPRQLSLTRKAVPLPSADPRGVHKEKAESSSISKPSSKPSDATGSAKPLPKPSDSPAPQSPPVDNLGTISPSRKRPPREVEQLKDAPLMAEKTSSPIQTPPGPHSTNGHAMPDQDTVKPVLRVSRSDRRPAPPGLTLSIATDEHIRDLRRMMARATNADECRVLIDMFLAKCGAPLGETLQPASGPITPPLSPLRVENEHRHETNLIEILLGDGVDSLVHTSMIPSEPASTTTTSPRSLEPPERPSPQRRESPILTLAPSPIVATT